jgi:hypothetical protein
VLFSRAILAGTAASQRFVVFGPTVQWHPDLWTFRDCDVEGPGGTLVLALLGTACGVEFNNTYFEATPQLTLAAPAGNVSFVDCKGHGVVLPATTGEKNQ